MCFSRLHDIKDFEVLDDQDNGKLSYIPLLVRN